MTFPTHTLQTHKQLFVLLLWIIFVGWTLWLHAQQSQQPPIHDAEGYYLKAYNFWTEIRQHKLFNPFNLDPTFRPPGTILMSYPFGFDIDYRGFYFRSIFLPIFLLSLAVIISGYRRELDNKCKWHLVLLAAFFSSLPCFYDFEFSSDVSTPAYWGLVDNFLTGVAALATAATVRSVLIRSLVWVGLSAVLASVCLLIKPTGVLIMMLIGLIWLGLSILKLKAVWLSDDDRKSTIQWLLRGTIIFAIPYVLVLALSFTSNYLSEQNLAYGNAAIVIMQTELVLSWSTLLNTIHSGGTGYPFVFWLFLMIILIGRYLWRIPADTKSLLIGLALTSCITLVFGIWFWIFGSGGSTQIRYFMPFALMATILALPVILTTMQTISNRKMTILSMLMIAPILNLGLLLPQRNAPIEWQNWTGVNLTSGGLYPVVEQTKNFAGKVKQEGRNVTLYSLTANDVYAYFVSVFAYERVAMAPMPTVSISCPIDWQRPSTHRKEEMLSADYWLFQPVRDPHTMQTALAMPSIDSLRQETLLFQAWATQLTANEGVTVVSDMPTARVVRITDTTRLESAFDALVTKHHWRETFVTANPKRRFSEEELAVALTLNPPSLENIKFGDRFYLRALSISRTGDDITMRVWWKPLSPLPEQDWALFIQSIDDEGEIVLNNNASFAFNRSLSSLDGAFLFEQITFKNPVENGTHRLAIGFIRPNQTLLIADKGTRDWGNQRVIVPLP